MNRHPLHRPTPTPRRPIRDRRGRRLTRTVRLITSATAVTAVVVLTCTDTAQAASADPHVVVLAEAASIAKVLGNIRVWAMGILAAWATLCLTIGFLRWTSGEPGEVERGKIALRSAAIGYAGALLVPLILTIVASWVS